MNSTTTIEIPTCMLQQIENLVSNLSVRNKQVQKKSEDVVSRIISHRVSSYGDFMFLVSWTDGVEEWVEDDDCSCECLISEYLRNLPHSINTAYLICRVSTKNQDNPTSISLDAQEDAIRSKITLSSFKRIKVIRVKKSAYTSMPSEILDICEAATDMDGIFFWRIDRFSRNIEKSIDTIKLLESKNVHVYSVEENLDLSNNKQEFYQHVLNGQKESSDISKRICLTLDKKRKRGDEKIGNLPYGKKYVRICDEYGATIRMVVRDNTSETETIECIKSSELCAKDMALHLNDQNITKKGKKWSPSMINYIRKK